MNPYTECTLCPRSCRVDRTASTVASTASAGTSVTATASKRGVCGATATVRIGRAALHWWEEPCLVGEQGSGAVFFAYCPLQCVYCQNRVLVEGSGIDVTDEELAALFLRLQNEEHAANINLVTPTHYTPTIARVLRPLRESGALHIPVVYNTSSFDSQEALRLMDGLVDVYLADFKYATPEVARRLSHAPSYPEVAQAALDEMLRQVPTWEEGELLRRGVIVRHLVLPGLVEESKRVLDLLASRYGSCIRLSIMNQYTPLAPHLERYGLVGTVTDEEYESVLDYADELGIQDYYWQEGGAAEESFVPAFDGTGVR